jgi:hypothetical protein
MVAKVWGAERLVGVLNVPHIRETALELLFAMNDSHVVDLLISALKYNNT